MSNPANAQELYDTLGPLQEKKGYYFNHAREHVMQILEQLLVTKGRYGYMSCPCRFANGEREKDKDIICPCAYRTEDVAEYGTCYCGLYVSKEWNEAKKEPQPIPERRPPENVGL